MIDLKQLALDEYNSPVTTAHHGISTGGTFWAPRNFDNDETIVGRPFWNRYATQFMFNPCFEFTPLPDCFHYRFTAIDCNQKIHTFEAETPMALLTPIWGDLPEGNVELRGEALREDGSPRCLIGARYFYRMAPFGGPDAYPPKARSYRECARMAFRFSYEMAPVQYWLTHGKPDPNYGLNIYPSKMSASIINTMLAYASMDSENAENAIQIAKNVADYMLTITYGDESPLKGLPPTYHMGFREPLDWDNNPLYKTLMMFYPAQMGLAYLKLADVTGDGRYVDAAMTIANYYRDHVLESGSWPLSCSVATGESIYDNECIADDIIPFLLDVYKRTGEPVWKELVDNAHRHRSARMYTYHWEGQFEDSPASAEYSNLSHFGADEMIKYIAQNMADDPEAIAQAEDMMRYVEDQFVVWGKHAPDNRWSRRAGRPVLSDDKADWVSPSALEQYHWYVPIDDSAAWIMDTFLSLYKATGKPLLLAKACALADSITRVQNPKTGMINTHWTRKTCQTDNVDFWLNCHNHTAFFMLAMANALE